MCEILAVKVYKPRRLEYSKRKVETGIALVNQSEFCMSQFQQNTNFLQGMNERELFVRQYIFIRRCVRNSKISEGKDKILLS